MLKIRSSGSKVIIQTNTNTGKTFTYPHTLAVITYTYFIVNLPEHKSGETGFFLSFNKACKLCYDWDIFANTFHNAYFSYKKKKSKKNLKNCMKLHNNFLEITSVHQEGLTLSTVTLHMAVPYHSCQFTHFKTPSILIK